MQDCEVKWPASCQSPVPSQARCLHRTATATPVLSGSQERLSERDDFPPPLCAKNLSFHGDSQIANPRESQGKKKKKLAYPQRSGHGWHWGCPLLRMKAEQSRAALLGPDGKISGMPGPQASGPWAQATGGGGSPSSLRHDKAQVNSFGVAAFLGRLLGPVFPWCFPVLNLKN